MDYAALSANQLVQACIDTGDEAAWEEFLNRYNTIVAATVARTARSWNASDPAVVEDLVQDVYVKLCINDCQLLRDFTGAHPDSLYAYLKVTAANLARDHFKARRAQKRGSGTVDESLDVYDPPALAGALGSSEYLQRRLLIERVERVLETTEFSPLQKAVFWLFYKQGFTAPELAAIPAVSLTVKGVESLLLRMSRTVRERTIAPRENDLPVAILANYTRAGNSVPISP